MKPLRIAHLSSVHFARDTRIFHKECRSLAARGHNVHLIVCADPEQGGEADGVHTHALPRPRGRLNRALFSSWRVFRKGLSLDADIYHFHDPELIPHGLLLRLMGRRVVYDIHEDNVSSIGQKHYLPHSWRPLLRIVGRLFGLWEQLAGRAFSCVLAERYYQDRFPRGTHVLNYPMLDGLPDTMQPAPEPGRVRLLYTGGHWRDRGGHIHARLLKLIPGAELHLVGRCGGDWADELRGIVGADAERLHIEGDGEHVPYARILEHYAAGGWTAGLAIFPDSGHFRRKELTKFFEYMGAGIPIVCSDFPVWRALVQENGCGICVDPADEDAQVAAILRLAGNPDEARAMGERGRALVLERFNWEREVDTLEQVYAGLIGEDMGGGHE